MKKSKDKNYLENRISKIERLKKGWENFVKFYRKDFIN